VTKFICLHKQENYRIVLCDDPENGMVVQVITLLPQMRSVGTDPDLKPVLIACVLFSEKVGFSGGPDLFKKNVHKRIGDAKTNIAKRLENNQMVEGVFADFKGRELKPDWEVGMRSVSEG